MRRCYYLALLTIIFSNTYVFSQPDLPQDYLSKDFHKGRRAELRKLMPDNSVVVVFAAPTRTFSNDVEYLYHQNPDLYYFTGYKEPHSVLFVFKEDQAGPDGSSFNELFFIQKRNPQAEQWTGKRLGIEGVKGKLGITSVHNGEEFQKYQLDLSKFDKIIFDRLPIDVPNSPRDQSELYDLMDQFRIKADITADYSSNKRFDNRLYRELTGRLREIKTDEELALIRKAVEISCQGQNEVMKVMARHVGAGNSGFA